MFFIENLSSATAYVGEVIKVTDGDFINLLHEGETLRNRLAEIDAPERVNLWVWRMKKEMSAIG